MSGLEALLIYPNTVESRERASASVAAGGIVAFRTDTFYGLGADPFNTEALEALNVLKGREGKPVLVLADARADAARLLARTSAAFDALAARHWPGALTLVGEARLDVPELLTAGTGTVGVRIPADEDARTFVRMCGGLLTATSANPAGRPPARTAEEVRGYFPSAPYVILDGGATRSELPSTVLDVSGPAPRLIREGVVTRGELEETLRLSGFGLSD